MQKNERYALGQQDFKILRERDCVYIDKTEYVHKIVDDGTQYFFLARPRRFGKSLFLSTLQYFFEGRRELFKGLYIDSTDWDWEPYPVLRLDLNRPRYKSLGDLDIVFDNAFKKWEAQYGITDIAGSYSARFENIIEAAHKKTGRQVVILVDEYDKPFLATACNEKLIEHYCNLLSSVYSTIKSSNEHIRLAFVVGVNRCNRHDAFDGRNNLVDISFSEEYAEICGITEQEMAEYLHQGISQLADSKQISYEMTVNELRRHYMGYRFSSNGFELFDPSSLLQALRDLNIINYFENAESSAILDEFLSHANVDLHTTIDSYCPQDYLTSFNLFNSNPTSWLYHNGYLTIAGYNKKINRYKLGIPNLDVKESLYRAVNFLPKTPCIEDWKIVD